MDRRVFISGATGYVGTRVAARLIERGWMVRALSRPGSEHRLPSGCEIAFGNALDPCSFAKAAVGCSTYIHLVGTPHPAPWKGAQFRAIDLVSLNASVTVATEARIQHFVYMSVAHPAPVMKAYIEVRAECEQRLRRAGFAMTFLRPWYVLGPGHRWPYALKPIYALMERIPSARAAALRLGLVTIDEMTAAIVKAAENPPSSLRIVEVPQIREAYDNDVHSWTTSSSSESA